VIDDILDSGRTLAEVRRSWSPSSRPRACGSSCCSTRGPGASTIVPADYVGFEIPDEFVVGYGLDFDGYYRNLPAIVTLRPEHVLDEKAAAETGEGET
jgi:hypoxanthine phosphoribosyltransferase